MRPLFFGFLLFCSSILHAATDAQVTQWTRDTLAQTIAIDYNYSESDQDPDKKRFTHYAWEAINDFLGGYVQVVRDKHLSLHPNFLVEPTVVDSGIASGIAYWRVNTEIAVPELQLTIAFSVIVIATSDSFLIQSLSMEKQENP